MSQFNITNNNSIEENYNQGLLPQRNNRDSFYYDSSCRSNLNNFSLSSENRRILRKTDNFSFEKKEIKDFNFDLNIQKQIYTWLKELNWDFPISSVKKIFTDHLFNYVYIWKDENDQVVAYSLCYFSSTISHIAYVFYDPKYNHSNLPIRLVLQIIIDSHQLNLKYCYLGRFSQTTGFYKRNMPGFEYFDDKRWIEYNKDNTRLIEN